MVEADTRCPPPPPSRCVTGPSRHELTGGQTHWLRPRAIGYGVVLLIMMTAFTVALFSRSAFEVDVLRERGELSRINAATGQLDLEMRIALIGQEQLAVQRQDRINAGT